MNSKKIYELREYILNEIQDLHPADQKEIIEELASDLQIMAEDLI